MKKKILFICTHNKARSQMAEGYLRARYGDRYEPFSGGTEPGPLDPMAVEVMKEIGIDISGQKSKNLSEFNGVEMDVAVAVCDSARAACPFFPWANENIHAEFPDPTGTKGTPEERVAAFREVRDRITSWIDGYFGDAGKMK
ncbi:arsenate reductase [Methanolinea mesophila]|uniref:arsenate reductase ArsC n=1 Tax=Methanolinea mesophila TaxID=547055 RepID=UPI001AE15FC7|nr:arsenate reductase ArsC [Methanolinea mesophila]MBP1929977.1 arsenate reductase [Methanolinea mesophila]